MFKKTTKKSNEKGAALVIAILAMIIMMGFAALALSRATSETIINAGDAAESRTFSVAEAALEDATRDFVTLVENKLVVTPTDADELAKKPVPQYEDGKYVFTKTISQVDKAKVITQTTGQFQGLVSLRDKWQITVTAREVATGAETQVRRQFFNDRIPLFQFGAFYQDDLEVNDPPLFIFNGRIHTNGNFFTNSQGSDIRYKSKITIAGELVRDRWKNGAALSTAEQSDNVYALNATNADTKIPKSNGSVTCDSSDTGGVLKDVTGRGFPYPKCIMNTSWTTFSKNFEGNVITHAKELKLPVNRIGVPLIEMIRRGKNVGDMENRNGTVVKVTADNKDNGVVAKERFANKEGLRVSLADSKDKLPQCANAGTNPCGVRLDGAADGKGSSGSTASGYGYQPLSLRNITYKTTRVNGNRLAVSGREVWIKIELVKFNSDTEEPVTEDVTEDILSLGVTKPVLDSNSSSANLQINGYTTDADSRSIINLQQFAVEGEFLGGSTSSYIRNQTIVDTAGISKKYNFVVRKNGIKTVLNYTNACNNTNPTTNLNYCADEDVFATPVGSSSAVSSDESAHYKLASFDNGITTATKNRVAIVPFPIQLQDTREGNRSNSTSNLTANQVFKNGVMSIVDINVGNLRRFFNKEFDNNLPATTEYAKNHNNQSLKAADVPSNRGWVLYFSDRRGDADFDGRYKMEDVKPSSNDLIDEDLNDDKTIDTPSVSNKETPAEDEKVDAGWAAVTDHSYYRRGVRLINGTVLPGNYDSVNPELTTGFTLASENGIYVWGNYNVESVSISSGTAATTSDKYSPQGKTAQIAGTSNGNLHIPAALIGDAVTVLSNAWNDGESFAYPNDLTKRLATNTYVRFAMLAGDPITGRSPSEGLNGAQNGGLINFKRFLESWSNDRLNYSGSLVNLFNSFNSNGRHKPNFATYNPPTRDWTFEESFKDPNRLPPGTPFVYYIDFAGFERLNE